VGIVFDGDPFLSVSSLGSATTCTLKAFLKNKDSNDITEQVGTPDTPFENTVFEWGTASHLLIWVSVLQLTEDGMLDLDADITNYLPEGDLKEELSDKSVTLMHLMNYSSGYHDSFSEKILQLCL
jgi:CubicO group peptidase (beta-lactamase class C family)